VWQTDGRTDILTWHSPRYAYASRDKNRHAHLQQGYVNVNFGSNILSGLPFLSFCSSTLWVRTIRCIGQRLCVWSSWCCIFWLHPVLYLLVSWAWWDWPLTWFTNHRPSVFRLHIKYFVIAIVIVSIWAMSGFVVRHARFSVVVIDSTVVCQRPWLVRSR